jgi:hypothetical protein
MRASRLVKLVAGIALTGASITYFGIRSFIDEPNLTCSSDRILSGQGGFKDYLDMGAILLPFLGVTGLAFYDTYRTSREEEKDLSLIRKRSKKT